MCVCVCLCGVCMYIFKKTFTSYNSVYEYTYI